MLRPQVLLEFSGRAKVHMTQRTSRDALGSLTVIGLAMQQQDTGLRGYRAHVSRLVGLLARETR